MNRSKKLRIGYFADGPWSHTAFELLINDKSIDIAFIVPRSDTKDMTLKLCAEKFGIDYLQNSRINSEEFLSKVKIYDCDLFVSMSFNQIFREPIINMPPLKTINCHAGKLPFYRGRNILNWVLINDESEFGITVHYMDKGIDTGDIILQRTFPITDEDDYGSLLEVAYVECANILYDAIKLLQKGEAKPKKQEEIHPVGFYCGQRKEGDEKLDWNQPSRAIFNFVRAISNPGPMARTFHNGNEVKINAAELIPGAVDYIGVPGQVLGKDEKTFTVKTSDNIIRVTDFEYEGKIRFGERLQ